MPENSKQALATNDFWGLSGEHDEVTLDFREACERRNLRNQGALAKRLLTNSR
jgi:hypothetical protein